MFLKLTEPRQWRGFFFLFQWFSAKPVVAGSVTMADFVVKEIESAVFVIPKDSVRPQPEPFFTDRAPVPGRKVETDEKYDKRPKNQLDQKGHFSPLMNGFRGILPPIAY
jgi:hypothetical protein